MWMMRELRKQTHQQATKRLCAFVLPAQATQRLEQQKLIAHFLVNQAKFHDYNHGRRRLQSSCKLEIIPCK